MKKFLYFLFAAVLIAAAIFYSKSNKAAQDNGAAMQEQQNMQSQVPSYHPIYSAFLSTQDSSFSSLKTNLPKLDEVIGIWLHWSGDQITEIDPQTTEQEVNYIRKNSSAKIQALVNNYSNGKWQGQQTADLLADPATRAKTEDLIVSNLKENSLDGVNVDFEQVPKSGQPQLVSFLQELHSKLQAQNLSLSVDLEPNDPNYDYKGIAENSDQVIIMFYDQNGFSSEPDQNTAISWFDKTLQALLDSVPANKMVVGLAWINDSNIVNAEIRDAQKYKPKGYAVFRLGYQDQNIWNVLP